MLSVDSTALEFQDSTAVPRRTGWWWSINRIWSEIFRFRHVRRAQAIFKGVGETIVARPFCGYILHLNVGRGITHQLAFLIGEALMPECAIVKQLVRPGMRAVDVGANVGYYLLLLERLVGANGAVVCIEPGPENLVELQTNISVNGFKNVEVHGVAVGAAEGSVGIRGGVNTGVSSGADVVTTVPIRTLTQTVNGTADFIKIDVEGYEEEVLNGAVDLIQNCQPTLLVEVHPLLIPRYGGRTSKVLEILRATYPYVAAFEKGAEEGALWSKVISRYGLQPAVRKVDSLDNLFERCDRGEYSSTFWVVASASQAEFDVLQRKF